MSKTKQVYPVCKKCEKEIKPIQLAPKKTMALYCDCGVFDKSGKEIYKW